MHTSGCRLIAWLHPLPAYLYHRSLLQLLLSLVLRACCTISILCSHSLQCGIIINSHLGEGRFPHHRMQWRFIATISKGLGEMYRMRERWKLYTYSTPLAFGLLLFGLVCPVRWMGKAMAMLRTINEYLVLFERTGKRVQISRLCCAFAICPVTSNLSFTREVQPIHKTIKAFAIQTWPAAYGGSRTNQTALVLSNLTLSAVYCFTVIKLAGLPVKNSW